VSLWYTAMLPAAFIQGFSCALSQCQDKPPIKGQANCANDTFTMTDKLRRSKLPHLIHSVSHYLFPLRHSPIFQNNGNGMARENCTVTNSLHFLSHHSLARDTHPLATQSGAHNERERERERGSVLEACKSHIRIIILSRTGCGERSLHTQQVPKG